MSNGISGTPPSKRKQWRDEDMVAAIEAVSSGGMTITASSRVFSVPRKTLDDRLKGHVTHGRKPGVKTALTSEEESSLVRYLLYMAERGFPLTRTMTKAFAWAIAKRSGNDCRFSKNYGPSGSCSDIDTQKFVFVNQIVLNAVVQTLLIQQLCKNILISLMALAQETISRLVQAIVQL